jgi:hypothetical protein
VREGEWHVRSNTIILSTRKRLEMGMGIKPSWLSAAVNSRGVTAKPFIAEVPEAAPEAKKASATTAKNALKKVEQDDGSSSP